MVRPSTSHGLQHTVQIKLQASCENDDKIDESHKSQLKFEYKIYLLNYTKKNKNLKTYIGLLRFFRVF